MVKIYSKVEIGTNRFCQFLKLLLLFVCMCFLPLIFHPFNASNTIRLTFNFCLVPYNNEFKQAIRYKCFRNLQRHSITRGRGFYPRDGTNKQHLTGKTNRTPRVPNDHMKYSWRVQRGQRTSIASFLLAAHVTEASQKELVARPFDFPAPISGFTL